MAISLTNFNSYAISLSYDTSKIDEAGILRKKLGARASNKQTQLFLSPSCKWTLKLAGLMHISLYC